MGLDLIVVFLVHLATAWANNGVLNSNAFHKSGIRRPVHPRLGT